MTEEHSSSFIPNLAVAAAMEELQGWIDKNQILVNQMNAAGIGMEPAVMLQMRMEMILEQIMPSNLDPDAPEEAPANNIERIKFEAQWQKQVHEVMQAGMSQFNQQKLMHGVNGFGGVDLTGKKG